MIRYKTIDNCLCNHYRHWTIEGLVDACCDDFCDTVHFFNNVIGVTKSIGNMPEFTASTKLLKKRKSYMEQFIIYGYNNSILKHNKS